mgnify:CR=1 FL=1
MLYIQCIGTTPCKYLQICCRNVVFALYWYSGWSSSSNAALSYRMEGGSLKSSLDSILCLYQAATVNLSIFCRQIFMWCNLSLAQAQLFRTCLKHSTLDKSILISMSIVKRCLTTTWSGRKDNLKEMNGRLSWHNLINICESTTIWEGMTGHKPII